jgi:hypothetical protein
MTRYTPQWLQAGSYSGAQDRRLISALWPGPASTGCAVTPSAGTMSVLIASGQVAVPTQNQSGSTLCTSDAIETVGPLNAAPGPGLNRYDLIICRPRGNDLDGGANTDFIFDFVTGTAAAAPTVPATPAGTVALAQIYIPAQSAAIVAGNITDVRPGGLAVPPLSGAGSPPRGWVASTVGPASQVNIGATQSPVLTLTAPLTAGRRYRASVNLIGSQQGAGGQPQSGFFDSAGYLPSGVIRPVWIAVTWPATAAFVGAAVYTFVATATANDTFTLNGGSGTGGTSQYAANSVQITVEDIGAQ